MMCPNCGTYNLPGNEVCSNCHQDLTPLDLPTPQNEVERSIMEDAVRILCPYPPILVTYDTTVSQAMQLLLNANMGALLVVDANNTLLGIFSERDLLKKIAGVYSDLNSLAVGDFMTPAPETIGLDDPLNFALHKMDAGGYRHLPVLENGKPKGMISVRDMLNHLTGFCK